MKIILNQLFFFLFYNVAINHSNSLLFFIYFYFLFNYILLFLINHQMSFYLGLWCYENTYGFIFFLFHLYLWIHHFFKNYFSPICFNNMLIFYYLLLSGLRFTWNEFSKCYRVLFHY